MFHQRYHRNSEGLINILAAQLDDQVVDMQEEWIGEALIDDLMEEEVDTLVLSDKQKYNRVMPVLIQLGNLISLHGTKSFLNYLEELKLAEVRVRRGQTMLPKLKRNDMETSVEEVENGTEETDEVVENETEETGEVVEAETEETLERL